ncbi:hypothetical protein ACG33_02385 [Steroidobacter denitrificans]|uniref:Uncharacterized protein n=1 Tax=Steroidobacter denitrificans TaxID=465721 RepID=A0A127F8P8_STEDE|nr:hypothetical protein [Steroidobacter denitrificans]AMN45978.1 hypothetical protein ACG33_02385 [Steroidobacter denitrificans]
MPALRQDQQARDAYVHIDVVVESMQQTLFPEPSGGPDSVREAPDLLVEPATIDPTLAELATALSPKARLGSLSNKAEECAPLSVIALAEAVRRVGAE